MRLVSGKARISIQVCNTPKPLTIKLHQTIPWDNILLQMYLKQNRTPNLMLWVLFFSGSSNFGEVVYDFDN